jgi:hypothetical protein
MEAGFFSNQWWAWFISNYSMGAFFVVGTIITLFKVAAIVHPFNDSDKILCLLKGWLYGFPGLKKDEIPEEK